MPRNDGKKFELLTKDFFYDLFKKLGYQLHKDRIQSSGTQDGFDIQFAIADNHIERIIYIECKDYKTDVDFGHIYTKSMQLESNYTLGKKDVLFFICPRAKFSNTQNPEKTEPILNYHKFPFEIRLLDISNGLDRLFATNEEIYKEIYPNVSNLIVDEQEEIERFKSILQSKGKLKKIYIQENDKRDYITLIKSEEYVIPRTVSKSKKDINSFYISVFENKLRTSSLRDLLVSLFNKGDSDGIIVLGNPGLGKSFELKQTALNLWHERDETDIIPFFRYIDTFLNSDEIERYLPTDWMHIPQLAIILDGLDEISDINNFKIKLQKFLTNNKRDEQIIKFVLSCRTNIYESIVKDVPNFDSYYLDEIPFRISIQYLKDRYLLELPIIEIYNLEKHYGDFLSNPFYLNLFGNYYVETKEIPKSKSQLMDKYVLKRLNEDDQGKYKYKAHDIGLVQNCCKKASLVMEAMQKNGISDSQLRKLLETEYSVFKTCCFVDKVPDLDEWKFEHRNLQEYFVSKAIEQLSVENIIEFISIDENIKKTHPSWQNSISYLINSNTLEEDKREKLIEWFEENDFDVLFNADADRINDAIRDKVFQDYFTERCIKQQLWIRTYDSGINDLAKFAQCDANIDFLIVEADRGTNHYRTRISAINLLSHMELYYKRDKIKSLVLKLLEAPLEDVDFNFKADVLHMVQQTGLYKDSEYIQEIINSLGDYDNHRVVSAVLQLIQLDSPEKHIEYIKAITPKVVDESNRKYQRIDNFITHDNTNLKAILKEFKDIPNIFFALEIMLYNPYPLDVQNKDVEDLLDKIILRFDENKDFIYERMLFLVRDAVEKNSPFYEFEKNVFTFFIKTSTNSKAFKDVYNSKINFNEKLTFLTEIADENTIQLIIEGFQKGDLEDKDVTSFRNYLSHRDFELSKKFEKFIIDSTDFVFEVKLITQSKSKDWIKFNSEKAQINFNLLFQMEIFEDKIKSFFKKIRRKIITYNQVVDNRKKFSNNLKLQKENPQPLLDILYETLRFKGGKVNQEDVLGVLHSDLYLKNKINLLILPNIQFKISDEQRENIVEWCFDNIDKIDFSYENKSQNNLKRYQLVWDFGKKLDIKYDENTYLNFLNVDLYSNDYHDSGDSSEFNYILNKVNKEAFKAQIEINLLSGKISDSAFVKHAKYALENNLKSTFTIIREFIINENNAWYSRKNILEEFIAKTNEIGLLKELVLLKPYDENRKDFSWEAMAILINKRENEFVINKILEYLKLENNIHENLMAIKYLISANYELAFKIFNEWIINHLSVYKKELNFGFNSQDWQQHSNQKSIPYLIDLIRISNDSLYHFKNTYKPSRIVHDTMRSICQNNSSEICLEVIDKLEGCLLKLENDDDDIFYVNTMINDTKDIYYQHTSKPMQFGDIASKIESYKYEMLQ